MESLKTQTDEQLVANFSEGSEASLNVLIKRHKATVLAYIYRTTRNIDVAEDVFQDTFIKVINNLKLGKYKEDGKFLPWVIRISHNLIIDYYRAKKKNNQISTDACEYDVLASEAIKGDSHEDNIIGEQVKNDISSLVARLPKEQREIVKMRYFWGLSFKEIAEHTNVSINTSLGRMRYALINLRKDLNEKPIQ
jgi:RNA polymerase sigma factor (sigma-70 family)